MGGCRARRGVADLQVIPGGVKDSTWRWGLLADRMLENSGAAVGFACGLWENARWAGAGYGLGPRTPDPPREPQGARSPREPGAPGLQFLVQLLRRCRYTYYTALCYCNLLLTQARRTRAHAAFMYTHARMRLPLTACSIQYTQHIPPAGQLYGN